MTKSNNRGWHRAWTWDVPNRTAQHTNGMIVRFTPSDKSIAMFTDRDMDQKILHTLSAKEGPTQAVRSLARLKCEALDGFAYAVKKHAYDTAKAERAPLQSDHA